MELITVRDMILSLPSRWTGRKTETLVGPKTECERLHELDLETCSIADVTAIVQDHWIELVCDECQEEVDCVVRLGESLYENAGCLVTRYICQKCIFKAQAMISGR